MSQIPLDATSQIGIQSFINKDEVTSLTNKATLLS